MRQYAFPGLGQSLQDAATEYAKMFPAVTHSHAREWLSSARQCKRSGAYRASDRARLVSERAEVARMMARAARIASR